MYFHIVQLLPTFQTSLVLVNYVPAKLGGAHISRWRKDTSLRNTLYSKHILHNSLSLWLGLVKVGGKRCHGSGMGTGEGPEGVFILKQLELKEYQDVKKPFVMFGGLNTPSEKWSSGTACSYPPDKKAIRR